MLQATKPQDPFLVDTATKVNGEWTARSEFEPTFRDLINDAQGKTWVIVAYEDGPFPQGNQSIYEEAVQTQQANGNGTSLSIPLEQLRMQVGADVVLDDRERIREGLNAPKKRENARKREKYGTLYEN